MLLQHLSMGMLNSQDVGYVIIVLHNHPLYLLAGAMMSLRHLSIGLLKTQDEVSTLTLALPGDATTLTSLTVSMSRYNDAAAPCLNIVSLTRLQVR